MQIGKKAKLLLTALTVIIFITILFSVIWFLAGSEYGKCLIYRCVYVIK